MFTRATDLEHALHALGELLAARHEQHTILVVGGGSLLLLGLISRPTRDLDMVAIATPSGLEPATDLPSSLRQAIEDVAGALNLPPDWLNAGPSRLMDLGLPPGAEARAHERRHGALTVKLLAREDQIALKLYATVDHPPGSKHEVDLRTLRPSRDELVTAARWARTHDPSEPFLSEMQAVLATFGVELDDA